MFPFVLSTPSLVSKDGGTNERPSKRTNGKTKIKCKWKFIALGDRRRFRTFKYFINFLLASILCGSQERYRIKKKRVSEKEWVDIGVEKELRSGTGARGGSCRSFFFHQRGTYRYRNVIKTSKWLWIASRVTPFRVSSLWAFFSLPTLLSTGAFCLNACFMAIAETFLQKESS